MNWVHPGQLIRRNPNAIPLHRKRVHQSVLWYCGESAGSAHVCVMHLVAVVPIHMPVRKVIVVDIVDVGDVCVSDIHAVEIAAAYAIPRDEGFTKT